MQALALTLNRARLMRDSHHPDTADDIRHTLIANVSYILGAGANPSLFKQQDASAERHCGADQGNLYLS
jgi:hypothetical protein